MLYKISLLLVVYIQIHKPGHQKHPQFQQLTGYPVLGKSYSTTVLISRSILLYECIWNIYFVQMSYIH